MTAAGAESPVASLPILIGYDLRRVLGEDTTGIYLEAVQESLDRTVTVKLSRRSSGDATDLARFEEEIYLCTRAKHPGLLNAIDSGEVDGRLFLVTESIRVRTLATELAEQGPVEEKRAAGLALDIESDFLRPVYPVDRVFPETFFTAEQVVKAKSYMKNKGWVHSLARSGR